MAKILRVFLRRTSQTPTDNLVQIGEPDLFPPKNVDEVHISVLFTWDCEEAFRLQDIYLIDYPFVQLGGPAFPETVKPKFTPGLYTKLGITRTTRGCDFKCPWCLVSEIEGKFKQLETVHLGNTIQDDNILISSRHHFWRVCQMLKKQKGIRFLGGLDCRLLKDWHIELLRDLSIKEIWLSLDTDSRKKPFEKAVIKLKKAGFKRNQIRCYVLAGFNEPIQASEGRLRLAYNLLTDIDKGVLINDGFSDEDLDNFGTLPFVQAYRPPGAKIELTKEDRDFIRTWSRPASIKAVMKE